MRRAQLLLLAFAACKGERSAAPAEPAVSTSSATSPAAPTPFRPMLGAMAICNKLTSTGAVSRCSRHDSGTGVAFVVGGQHAGFVLVLPPEKYRAALDRFEAKKGELLATSDSLGALVIWTSSGELVDAQVRLGLAEAESLATQ